MDKRELLEILCGKDKKETYEKFKNLLANATAENELYEHFDEIAVLLNNERSHVRLRSFVLLCAISSKDADNKIEGVIGDMLRVLDDDKPTVIRQCLSALISLIENKPQLCPAIIKKVNAIDCAKFKDSMRPLIAKDIFNLMKSTDKR